MDNIKDIETVLTSPNCIRDERYRYIKDTIGVEGMFTSDGNRTSLLVIIIIEITMDSNLTKAISGENTDA